MLRPTKHSHPDRTVMNASLMLLSRLKSRRLESYDGLRTYVKNLNGCRTLLPLFFWLSFSICLENNSLLKRWVYRPLHLFLCSFFRIHSTIGSETLTMHYLKMQSALNIVITRNFVNKNFDLLI